MVDECYLAILAATIFLFMIGIHLRMEVTFAFYLWFVIPFVAIVFFGPVSSSQIPKKDWRYRAMGSGLGVCNIVLHVCNYLSAYFFCCLTSFEWLVYVYVIYIYTHIHTHTHIYIYICSYMYMC